MIDLDSSSYACSPLQMASDKTAAVCLSIVDEETSQEMPNFSRYLVATSRASSTFSGCCPLPIMTAPLPPALPPITPETAVDHSAADAPFLLASLRYG
jgi:hypothetical protein